MTSDLGSIEKAIQLLKVQAPISVSQLLSHEMRIWVLWLYRELTIVQIKQPVTGLLPLVHCRRTEALPSSGSTGLLSLSSTHNNLRSPGGQGNAPAGRGYFYNRDQCWRSRLRGSTHIRCSSAARSMVPTHLFCTRSYTPKCHSGIETPFTYSFSVSEIHVKFGNIKAESLIVYL